MNPMLKKLLARYMAPAGDDGSDTGGADTANTDVAALDDDDAYMAQSEEDRRRLQRAHHERHQRHGDHGDHAQAALGHADRDRGEGGEGPGLGGHGGGLRSGGFGIGGSLLGTCAGGETCHRRRDSATRVEAGKGPMPHRSAGWTGSPGRTTPR